MLVDLLTKRNLILGSVAIGGLLVLIILGGFIKNQLDISGREKFDAENISFSIPKGFEQKPHAIGFKFESENGEYFVAYKGLKATADSLSKIESRASEDLSGNKLANITTNRLEINDYPVVVASNSRTSEDGLNKVTYYIQSNHIWNIEFYIKADGALKDEIENVTQSVKFK